MAGCIFSFKGIPSSFFLEQQNLSDFIQAMLISYYLLFRESNRVAAM